MAAISPDLPDAGQIDWAAPLNEALTEIVAGVNAADAEINGRLAESSIIELVDSTVGNLYGFPFVFSKSGTLAITVGTHRQYNDLGRTLEILKVRASVGTAPTGSALTVDVNKNGTTILSSNISIAASAFTATPVTPTVTTLADGDYLTVDIDAVGSSVAGSDLTVTVWVR